MTKDLDPRQLLENHVKSLPPELRDHITRVRYEAQSLAKIFELDEERIDLAVLAHDAARLIPDETLLRMAHAYGHVVLEAEEAAPILLHGPIASYWLSGEWGLDDPEICEAVRWHSTARISMAPIAKVVFLADKLDPAKKRRYPYATEVRRLAAEDLDVAIGTFLYYQTRSLLDRGMLIHPSSIELLERFLRDQPWKKQLNDPASIHSDSIDGMNG